MPNRLNSSIPIIDWANAFHSETLSPSQCPALCPLPTNVDRLITMPRFPVALRNALHNIIAITSSLLATAIHEVQYSNHVAMLPNVNTECRNLKLRRPSISTSVYFHTQQSVSVLKFTTLRLLAYGIPLVSLAAVGIVDRMAECRHCHPFYFTAR